MDLNQGPLVFLAKTMTTTPPILLEMDERKSLIILNFLYQTTENNIKILVSAMPEVIPLQYFQFLCLSFLEKTKYDISTHAGLNQQPLVFLPKTLSTTPLMLLKLVERKCLIILIFFYQNTENNIQILVSAITGVFL